MKIARRRSAAILPDDIDADHMRGFFDTEDIFGWKYERPLNSPIGLSLSIEEKVRE
jgi:hypothetical protein